MPPRKGMVKSGVDRVATTVRSKSKHKGKEKEKEKLLRPFEKADTSEDYTLVDYSLYSDESGRF